ncbi:MAG: long-chain-fatty-acid--CoA ligase [Burkholderiaceae bacterium]
MDRFWIKSYAQGVPADIDPAQYASLTQLMEQSFSRYASRDAYVCMDKAMTYSELDALSRKLAAWLQSTGMEKGARVGLMMPNILQYPVAIAAVLRAGYTVVNINPLYTPRELAHQLKDSGAEAIIILENFAHTLQKARAQAQLPQLKHIVVASMGDLFGKVKGAVVNLVVRRIKKLVPTFSLPESISFKEAMRRGARNTLRTVSLAHDDIAFLQYTGGTTGVAKGAMLTHRNLIANVLQTEAWLQPGIRRQPAIGQLRILCALPLYHIFALTSCGLLGIRTGALNILIPNPRDIPDLVKTIGKYKPHKMPAVNTLFNALLNHPDFDKLDFSALRICNGGGMAVQAAVAEKWVKVTGCPIIEGYGLSETSPVATCNPCSETEIFPFNGTIGLPLPSTEIVILNEKDQPVPIDQAGEIAIRGPQVMLGYWNRPDETAKAMTEDGFFKSGDIGIMNKDGYVKIIDRKKDMILVSGFNVYPNEIEGVVAAHPGVLESACVGVPDEHTGEAVKLFVVRKDPLLTSEQLLEYCKTQLTNYKRPKYIEFRNELPKTNVGKILRRELREMKTAA